MEPFTFFGLLFGSVALFTKPLMNLFDYFFGFGYDDDDFDPDEDFDDDD